MYCNTFFQIELSNFRCLSAVYLFNFAFVACSCAVRAQQLADNAKLTEESAPRKLTVEASTWKKVLRYIACKAAAEELKWKSCA